jgi:ribosomal protein L2
MARVGTMVRDHMYDASIAKITASASGTNRYFATPERKNMGMKTMQMHSVETKAGTAICWAPSRMA